MPILFIFVPSLSPADNDVKMIGLSLLMAGVILIVAIIVAIIIIAVCTCLKHANRGKVTDTLIPLPSTSEMLSKAVGATSLPPSYMVAVEMPAMPLPPPYSADLTQV